MRSSVLALILLFVPRLATAQVDGRAQLGRGIELQQAGKLDEAIAAYEKAIAARFAVPIAAYNLATAYALKQDKDRAFAALELAAQAGFARLEDLERDPDLASLRADARWPATLRKMDEAAHPCKASPLHRQLDFWLGEWEVRDPQGALVGTSSVQQIIEGCVIYEHWSGRNGGTGKSFNFYNAEKKAWQQTWVDSQGGSVDFTGKLDGGAMRYQAVVTGADGRKVLRRMSFTPLPDGRVRQHAERSMDEGKTWTTGFEGLYSRKK